MKRTTTALKRGIESPTPSWVLKLATAADVERTVRQLTAHMDAEQRRVFRAKLCRYVREPDRDLVIAVDGHRVLGLICVVEQDRVPLSLPPQTVERLAAFACGTALLVHPNFRGRGIGSSLHRHAEQWARDRGRLGYWLVTHRRADWYQRDFGYQEVGRIQVNGIEKKVMAKGVR